MLLLMFSAVDEGEHNDYSRHREHEVDHRKNVDDYLRGEAYDRVRIYGEREGNQCGKRYYDAEHKPENQVFNIRFRTAHRPS